MKLRVVFLLTWFCVRCFASNNVWTENRFFHSTKESWTCGFVIDKSLPEFFVVYTTVWICQCSHASFDFKLVSIWINVHTLQTLQFPMQNSQRVKFNVRTHDVTADSPTLQWLSLDVTRDMGFWVFHKICRVKNDELIHFRRFFVQLFKFIGSE